MWALLIAVAGLALPAAAETPTPPVSVSEARASLTGTWKGQLEYRDYRADKWFGIPVTTSIENLPDSVTTIRRSSFDDGPKVGIVLITSIELFDPTKGMVSVASFRKGRTPELMTYNVRVESNGSDAQTWRMVEETRGTDNNRPATLRLTTTRSGDALETIKEVDFLDDNKTEWLQRNRSRLMRVP